ncbi:MAG TPA: methyltransferase, partial [Gaiellaceae bacterium]|nr:methyltransferase [Gaiellaceae bacterium]
MSAWDPNPDLAAAATLGNALRAAGYTTEAIEELLGDDGPSADLAESVVFERRLPSSQIATAIRLLLLQRPVERADAAAALTLDGVAALLTIGLVTEHGTQLVPRARIVPSEELLLAFDGFSRGDDDPPGWVSSFTPTAYWLASLTPRRRVGRALDIGTGNGAHALLAARHADRVTATDINPRALAFTQISAALNGIDNVETRLGSLFEPVAGETFDLITCNAPYVISPESRWQYRDGGLPGDQLSERVVRESALHLADGGHASVLVSWLAESEDEPDERVYTWLEGNGCDAWVLGLSGADPLDHAAGWNEHFAGDADSMGAALDDWASYFEALDAGWVTEGAVLMRKRASEHHVVRADPVDEEELEFASDQIERVFTALALLAEQGAAAVKDAHLSLAEEVRFDQELDRRGDVQETRIVLDEGTCPDLELELETAQVLTSLDGHTTLDQAVERTARRLGLGRRETAELRHDALEVVRELFELGFFDLARVRA